MGKLKLNVDSLEVLSFIADVSGVNGMMTGGTCPSQKCPAPTFAITCNPSCNEYTCLNGCSGLTDPCRCL